MQKFCLHKLTLDEKIHRLADLTTDTIRPVAPEQSLVIAGHINYSKSGASVSELDFHFL